LYTQDFCTFGKDLPVSFSHSPELFFFSNPGQASGSLYASELVSPPSLPPYWHRSCPPPNLLQFLWVSPIGAFRTLLRSQRPLSSPPSFPPTIFPLLIRDSLFGFLLDSIRRASLAELFSEDSLIGKPPFRSQD